MREVWICPICGKRVDGFEPHVWVRRRGCIYFYHAECAKGGGKV